MTMTTDRNASCQDRIAEHLASRDEYLDDLYGAMAGDTVHVPDDIADAEDPEEAAREAMWELPLSVETTKTIRVLLSTGGPSDGLKIELDRDGNVSRIVYWFADWFDYAETVVSDDESGLYRYAEELAELEQDR